MATKQPPSVKRIVATQEKIYAVCKKHIGATIAGEDFLYFARLVHQQILSTDAGAVHDSMRSVAGREMSEAAAQELSWRLAGNLHRLAAGVTVPPWTAQTEKEWVVIQVSQLLKRFRNYRAKTQEQAMRAGSDGLVRKTGVAVKFVVLSGLPAGREFERFWSSDFCELVKNEFGFNKFNHERFSRNVSARPSWPFLNVSEFYRMRVRVLLDPELCQFGELGFEKIVGTASTKAWCREIMRRRLRDGYDCPDNQPPDFSCHICERGSDFCLAACHASTYQVGRCDVCKRDDRYFDPDIDLEVCIDCCVRQY